MKQNLIKLFSWLAGILGVVAIIWYFRPEGFAQTIVSIGVSGLVGWVVLTLVARLLMAETTVLPVRALGFDMPRLDAFWIGWIRTFANQILPLSGVAAYAKVLRGRIDISWSELAALAAPQFVLALTALGVVGLLAATANLGRLDTVAFVLAGLYLAVVVFSIATATGAHWFIELLPDALSTRAARAAAALRKLATHPGLVAKMIAYHALAMLLRGGRLWILFTAAGVPLDWQAVLLVLAMAESTVLINVTPGGLGIREGFVLSGSALVGVPPPVAASVALVDRLFVISIVTLLTAPSLAFLRRES